MPDNANSEVYFAFPDAMQGSLPDTIREVRPTHLLGVPRVWEKFYLGLGQLLQAKPELKSNPTAVKAFLGLEQVRLAVTGAAPIADEVVQFFDNIELPLYEVYGMTENTAYSHFNQKGRRQIGSVGPQLADEGAGSKIDAISCEICTWSRAVMMGYMYMPEKTADTFDDEGFLRTGDVGVEKDGFTFITGRIKEMIITAGGENMAPVLLESALKERMPALSNVMMIGDRQKYLIALMTLKLEPDGKGGFTNKLDAAAKAVDPDCKTFEDVQKSKIWATYLAQGVEDANKVAISRAQLTRKYTLLPGDFSPVGENCELTPTMKLKRDVAAKKYLGAIKACYGDDYVA
jgi:long-chain-fatty-acid--CoA ligase ACSBG